MTKKSSQTLAGIPATELDAFDAAIDGYEVEIEQAVAARIPPEHGSIQINFCKNPSCDNFGKPEECGVAKWAKNSEARNRVTSAGKSYAPTTPSRSPRF